MASIKFPCSNCQKPMAVGPELAGSQVRCPHCFQVLLAPQAASSEPAVSDNQFQFGNALTDRTEQTGNPTDGHLFNDPPAASHEEPFALEERPKEEYLSADDSPLTSGPVGVGPARLAVGRSSWVLAILVPYAVFMTVMAIFYYYKYSSAINETPLDRIPDLLGQFQQKQTKGVPQTLSIPLPPADQNLPSRLLTNLGKAIQIGSIEVTPLSVEFRPWTAFTKMKNRNEPRKTPIKATLVMHVRLKNISQDLTYYPTDPYFDRNPKQASDRPYTLVDVGGRKFYGGLIEYVTEPGNAERTWLAGQENDDQPLGPGESRETVLVARPGDRLYDALTKAREPAIWRMQVRRGLLPYHGTEIPVSAVVGMVFTAADVRKSG